jgi:hypothetical protein
MQYQCIAIRKLAARADSESALAAHTGSEKDRPGWWAGAIGDAAPVAI